MLIAISNDSLSTYLDPYESSLTVAVLRDFSVEVIFLSDENRYRFLDVLSELVHDFNRAVHAYCLIDNHYHLLIETPEGNLSKGTLAIERSLHLTVYPRHGRVGHVFQDRISGKNVIRTVVASLFSKRLYKKSSTGVMATRDNCRSWISYRGEILKKILISSAERSA